jgi:hypothetical protein
MVPSLDIFDGDLMFKLVCFGANGVIIFQCLRTRVIMKLIEKLAPFVIGIHYIVDRCNLVM